MVQGGARDLLLFVFDKKQPATVGLAEFTIERSEELGITGTPFFGLPLLPPNFPDFRLIFALAAANMSLFRNACLRFLVIRL